MSSENQQLTSVKVQKDIFEEFKVLAVRNKFSLQKLVDRGMYLYITSEEFRRALHNQNNLNLNQQ
jgi:hypothetical protein